MANGASSYTDGFSIDKYTLHVRNGRRYILNLHPRQSYTRFWKPLEQLAEYSSGLKANKANFFRPLRGKDPDEQHKLHNIRGNGLWLFEPDLQNSDCRDLFHASENIATSSKIRQSSGVHPGKSRQSAFVVFKVSSANVITSMSLEAKVVRRQSDDVMRIWISRTAGIRCDFRPTVKRKRPCSGPCCTPLSNRGLGISEFQVFDMVTTSPAPPLVAPFPF